jgi:hypothetical protein
MKQLAVPAVGQVSEWSVELMGLRTGLGRVKIAFQQGSTDLASLTLGIVVTDDVTDDRPVHSESRSAPRNSADGLITKLFIQEDYTQRGAIVLNYYLTSSALSANAVHFKSEPLDASRSTPRTLDLVESIYKELVERSLASTNDWERFNVRTEGTAVNLARAVIPPELLRVLWQSRDSLHAVHVLSNDPHIPWELLKLSDPDTKKVDRHYLAEYRLTRSLQGHMPPSRLHIRDWAYVAAQYDFETLANVSGEISFIKALTNRFQLNAPREIKPEVVAIVDALKQPDFDVLHVAAHGRSDPRAIESAALFIGDEQTSEGVLPIELRTTDLVAANLTSRSPIVFLNACESAKLGRGLANMGGWPRTFWDAGAGAFVGALWPVRSEAAETFARTFYEMLFQEETLCEATQVARKKARKHKDASWLAYSVYGRPLTQVAGG